MLRVCVCGLTTRSPLPHARQRYKEYVSADPYIDQSRMNEALIKRIIAKGGDTVEVRFCYVLLIGLVLMDGSCVCLVGLGDGCNALLRRYWFLETRQVKDGRLFINGMAQEENFIAEGPEYTWGPSRVPDVRVVVGWMDG